MKKTGYEIVGMIKDGKAPKKIKSLDTNCIYYYDEDEVEYKFSDLSYLDLLVCLNDEFEIIEDSKIWKPKTEENFYCIEEDGNVTSIKCYLNKTIEDYYEIGNCFKTREEVEKTREKIKIYMQLKRYAEEHNTEKIDWDNFDQSKWFIRYDFSLKKLVGTDLNVIKDINQVYFTSEELCHQAIKEIGEDNIIKLFED